MKKDEYFVQIGMRRNGRIVKNEQYTIDQFVELIDKRNIMKPTLIIDTNIFIRLFYKRVIKNIIEDVKILLKMRKIGYISAIIGLIKEDNFGKKEKINI